MTLAQMSALVSQRLNEGAALGGPTFYPTAEINAALNEANRLFCLLTLGLETTASWTIGATFTHMLTIFGDWIAPLRLNDPFNAKIRPTRLESLWSLDSQWPAAQMPDTATRYAAAGADLIAVYPQLSIPYSVQVTYARAPLAMTSDSDVPETPAEYHTMYVSYAIYRMRQAEGGEPFASTLPLLAEFLDAATEYGNFIRMRNIGSNYDTLPFELALFDRSRLVGVTPAAQRRAA